MNYVWPVALLLLCLTIEECESNQEYIWTDPADIMNRTDDYSCAVDFRCHLLVLMEDFDFREEYSRLGYGLRDDVDGKKHTCVNEGASYYPIITGMDPMMPLYINILRRGVHLAAETDLFFLAGMTPLKRSKEYCLTMQLIATAFVEYWEKFHSDSTLCKKIVELVKFCHVFRQTRELFTARLHDKLCLDEDGCYNAMDYYEDDLPYCVKYTAISEFKNSSVGSWHHTIINYCKLTEMVPETKAGKYDRTILTQTGRTREKLREMCLYLRYRFLPEEGKEQEIPEDEFEDDTFDTETTTETEKQNGLSNWITTTCWTVTVMLYANHFRCHLLVLMEDFDFREEYSRLGYGLRDDVDGKKHTCVNEGASYYPIITGMDPMMPLYINILRRGVHLAAETDLFFLAGMTPLKRSKEYCLTMQLIATAFVEYWEKFHSDSTLCKKIVELVKFCHVFRQTRELFTARLHDKLCLDEDGCYNAMDYYEDDLPYCVKYTAISEFKNSSVGSWHHTIINYCKLTEMVPETKAGKYDRTILTQTGRTREKLREMCLYLRYRFLPEEGKEQEIPEDQFEDDTFDTETTTETETEKQNGLSNWITTTCWTVTVMLLVKAYA